MTTASAAARPYSVFFDALSMPAVLLLGTDRSRVVDVGLSPAEKDELIRPDLKFKLILINIFSSVLAMGLGVMAVFLGTSFAVEPEPLQTLAPFVTVAGVGVIGGFLAANRVGGKIRRETEEARGQLLTAGKIAFWNKQTADTKSQLHRIRRALERLQEKADPAFDIMARQAVAAVIRQDDHEPGKRQLTIAESDATDPASEDIRTRTLAARTKWRTDVAEAERLVLEFERAAAGADTKERVAQ